jgi:iron complex transport system substrate-binding protein
MDPLLSVGKGTFVDDLIRLAGGRNIAEQAGGKYPRLSMEEVLAQNPEIILLASMNSQDAMAEERRYWQRWKSLPAVRNGRIYAVDSDLILRPSPRIVEGLEARDRHLKSQPRPGGVAHSKAAGKTFRNFSAL